MQDKYGGWHCDWCGESIVPRDGRLATDFCSLKCRKDYASDYRERARDYKRHWFRSRRRKNKADAHAHTG